MLHIGYPTCKCLLAALLLVCLACQGPSTGESGSSPRSGGAAGSAAAPAQSDAAAGPLSVRVSQAVDTLSFTSLYVAKQNGYFTEEGLELEIFTMGGGGPDMQALIAGDVQFNATGGATLITAFQEGASIIGVVNLLNRTIVNAAMHKDVAQAKGIGPNTPFRDKLAALHGLTIGATRPGALTYQLGAYFVKKAGLTPGEDVKLLGVGSEGAMMASLEQRKVDVILNSPPGPEEAIRQGFAVMFINTAAGEDPDLSEFLHTVVVTRPEYARERPDVVRRMVRALVRGNRWVAEHSAEEVAGLLQSHFGQIAPETLLESVRSVRPGVPADGRFTERGVLANYHVLEVAGALKGQPAWDSLVTNEYLPQ